MAAPTGSALKSSPNSSALALLAILATQYTLRL
jgi:hypothetical protein